MKKIILCVLTLGLVVASCNKEEPIPEKELSENIESNKSELDEYIYKTEVEIFEKESNKAIKFIVYAESEEVYENFMSINTPKIEINNKDIVFENVSTDDYVKSDFSNQNEKPKVVFQLLENTNTIDNIVSLSFESVSTTKSFIYAYPVGYTSSKNSLKVNVGNGYGVVFKFRKRQNWYNIYFSDYGSAQYVYPNTGTPWVTAGNTKEIQAVVYKHYYQNGINYSVSFK